MLTYKCVICRKKLNRPVAGVFTCSQNSCKQKYHTFLVDMHRKIFKLRKIKEKEVKKR